MASPHATPTPHRTVLGLLSRLLIWGSSPVAIRSSIPVVSFAWTLVIAHIGTSAAGQGHLCPWQLCLAASVGQWRSAGRREGRPNVCGKTAQHMHNGPRASQLLCLMLWHFAAQVTEKRLKKATEELTKSEQQRKNTVEGQVMLEDEYPSGPVRDPVVRHLMDKHQELTTEARNLRLKFQESRVCDPVAGVVPSALAAEPLDRLRCLGHQRPRSCGQWSVSSAWLGHPGSLLYDWGTQACPSHTIKSLSAPAIP